MSNTVPSEMRPTAQPTVPESPADGSPTAPPSPAPTSAPTPVSRWWKGFGRRVWGKILSVAPIVVGGLVFLALVSLLMVLITPLLPAPWQETLRQLSEASWPEARHQLREMLEGTGFPVELAFMGFQVLQVVIAPIPGQLAGLLGGFLFGFWFGLFLTMAGLALGSFLAMFLGRILGDRVIRRLVPRGLVRKFDELIAAGGLWNFFLLFTLPVLPDDAICFVAGLTRLNLWRLLGVCVLGRLPGMAVLCFVGASAGAETEGMRILGATVFALALMISLVLWLFSEEVERWLLGRRPFSRSRPS